MKKLLTLILSCTILPVYAYRSEPLPSDAIIACDKATALTHVVSCIDQEENLICKAEGMQEDKNISATSYDSGKNWQYDF